jgi:hypothetical protein
MKDKVLQLIIFLAFHALPHGSVSSNAACSLSSCSLPFCSCGRTIPGGLKSIETPQFILLSFDDAVNDLNKDFYNRLFAPNRRNPSGCGIKATFFVSHEWTDYSQVHDLFVKGHEIASHTLTHSWPVGFSVEQWAKEVVGMEQSLVNNAKVSPTHVKGMRAPFLKPGGDDMFEMLLSNGFLYDSSLPSNVQSPALWPYTLDHPIPHSCNVEPCPSSFYPGLWEVPMTYMKDDAGGHCAMLDGCLYPDDTEMGIRRMLTKNFLRHYTSSTKAPMPLFYHAAWFRARPHRERALHNFIDDILGLPDVYFVTMQQLLDWVKVPLPVDQVRNSLSCPATPAFSQCKKNKCQYGQTTMVTCLLQCPLSPLG